MSRTLMLIDIKMKQSVAVLGHNCRLKIYVDPKKITSTQAFIFLQNGLVYLAEILFEVLVEPRY